MRDIPDTIQPIAAPGQLPANIVDQLNLLGVKAAEEGAVHVGRAALMRAAAMEPRADILANAGNACRVCWRFQEAEELIGRALEMAPMDGRLWTTKGLLLLDLNRYREAADCFNKGMELSPPTTFGQLGMGLSLLGMGRIAEGVQWYESRFAVMPPRQHNVPRWEGQSLKGKLLHVECEQGLGDSIMFSRYLSKIQGNYVFSVQPQLQALFPQAKRYEEEIRADYWIPLMSLPRFVEARPHYAPIQPTRFMPLQSDAKYNIGVFWKAKAAGKGGPQEMRHGEQKSCPMELFLDLACLPNVRLHSLQFGDTIKDNWNVISQPPINDFADMASYMSQLDMVVGVDTGPIHLAGMMDRPTILLLNAVGSWQWGSDEVTPWYRTVQTIRQPKPHDWVGAMDLAKAAVIRHLMKLEEAEQKASEKK